MTKNAQVTIPEIIDSVEALTAKMAAMREAQKVVATYTQEQVDKIFYEAAKAANQQRIPLAKMAVAETGMGVVEDKVIKNNYAAEYIYNAYKNTKTCGVIEEDKAYGIKKIAEPIGLIAAVIPTTNPTSTAIFKTLIALKTRNAIIISPHPRAKACTSESRRSGGHHRLDRCSISGSDPGSHEEFRYHPGNRRSWHGTRSLLLR